MEAREHRALPWPVTSTGSSDKQRWCWSLQWSSPGLCCWSHSYTGKFINVLFRRKLYFHVIADSVVLFKRLVNITESWPEKYKNRVKFIMHDVWYPPVSILYQFPLGHLLMIILYWGHSLPSWHTKVLWQHQARAGQGLAIKRPAFAAYRKFLVLRWIPCFCLLDY